MKKLTFMTMLLFATALQAQEIKQIPVVNVSGEGKIKVEPDQALITISVETKGNDAADVKKENDKKMDAVLKLIKKANIAQQDFQTQRVSLNPNYDYEKKKNYYLATQTVQILLKDLSKYDALMEGTVDAGINRINNVEFKTSKLLQLQSDARKLAIKDAKTKADDFVSVLGQKLGKAITISDNSAGYNPPPVMYRAMMKTESMSDSAQNETLAIGEIEIVVNVSVSFILE